MAYIILTHVAILLYNEYALLNQNLQRTTPLFPTSSAAFIPVALHFLPVALLCAAANQQTHCERRMAVPHAPGVKCLFGNFYFSTFISPFDQSVSVSQFVSQVSKPILVITRLSYEMGYIIVADTHVPF